MLLTVMASCKDSQTQADLLIVKEIGMEPKPNPDMFPKAPCSISGYGDDVEIPKIAQDDQADYEGELTIVIGKDAKNVSEEDALEYVLGYTVADDVSARSESFQLLIQSVYTNSVSNLRKWMMDPKLVGTFPPPQMSFGKSFDTFAPIGPCIVSAQVKASFQYYYYCTVFNRLF